MELPLPLQPWRRYLSWFDAGLAEALGDLLRRLQPLLGPAETRHGLGELEPDGIDDLRRRGGYARLLLSEWALADVEPDEFLRRAASNEHLFLAPRLVRSRSDLTVVALFDAGPGQLGAPRLVHLALAIALAQRAEQLGARLLWGCLQQSEALVPLQQAEHLQQLLNARSLQLPDTRSLAHWQAQIAALPTAPAECWLIGPEDAAPLPATHRAQLQRSLDGGVNLVLRSRRQRREALLPPLPPAVATHLLGGRFVRRAGSRKLVHGKPAHRVSLKQAPVLDRHGGSVMLPLLDSKTLLCLRGMRGLQERPGRINTALMSWRRGAELLATCFIGASHVAGVVLQGQRLHAWNLKGFDPCQPSSVREFNLAPGQGSWLRCVLLRQAHGDRLLLLDHAGNLFDWRSRRLRERTLPELPTHALAVHDAGPDCAVIATATPNTLQLQRLAADGSLSVLVHMPNAGTPRLAFLAGTLAGAVWNGACAWRREGSDGTAQRWNLLHRLGEAPTHGSLVSLPPGVRVLGLAADPQSEQGYALLGLATDRRSLHLYAAQSREIHRAATAIAQVGISEDGTRVAMLNQERRLQVLDIAGGEIVTEFGGGA